MFAFVLGFLPISMTLHAAHRSHLSPTVAVRNGSYAGVQSTTYNQDFLLHSLRPADGGKPAL